MDLTANDLLVRASVECRPSKRNKSPYVADLTLLESGPAGGPSGREVIVHVPSMDMGGNFVQGAEMLVRPARDRKGNLIGSKAVGKYGTPKCEFIAQLLRVKDPENEHLADGRGVWVAAHPSIGESLAQQMLEKGLLNGQLPGGEVVEIRREVRNVAGTNMRVDFLLTHKDGSQSILEIKTVVDTDYNADTAPKREKCVFLGPKTGAEYRRAAIFPWGNAKQKGPDGESVVSARAIKHVDELGSVAAGEMRGESGEKYGAAILFVVVRADAKAFRPNAEACPSFVRHLKMAKSKGVRVLAHRVSWGELQDEGKAFWDGPMEVIL